MLLQLTLPKLTIESPVEKSLASYAHPASLSVPGLDPSTGEQVAQISWYSKLCLSSLTFSFNLTEVSKYCKFMQLVRFHVCFVLNLFGLQWLVLCINSRHPGHVPWTQAIWRGPSELRYLLLKTIASLSISVTFEGCGSLNMMVIKNLYSI